MTLPTGQISMRDVNIELGRGAELQLSLDFVDVRALAGIPSGQISMADLQGKSVFGQDDFESWATSNGYTLILPACSNSQRNVWGNPYTRVTEDSDLQKLCYMSIEAAYANSVIGGGGLVGYKTTGLGIYPSYGSVTRNGCTSKSYGQFRAMQISIVYFVPSNGLVRRKDYTNGFSTINI